MKTEQRNKILRSIAHLNQCYLSILSTFFALQHKAIMTYNHRSDPDILRAVTHTQTVSGCLYNLVFIFFFCACITIIDFLAEILNIDLNGFVVLDMGILM